MNPKESIISEKGKRRAGEMYHDEIREVEHLALNKDLFLQKPISNDDLIREIKKRIGSI